jgi:hypothetical protein
MMLSQSNIDKLIMTGLYSHEIPRPDCGYGYDPRWCKNWTFTVHEYKGTYRMRDTYWGSGDSLSFELTDENFDEFTFLFDFEKVSKTSCDIWREYDEDKKYWAPTDSGGTYCGGSYFILKGAKPSKILKREILIDEIHSAETHLEYKRNELVRLDADGMSGYYE